MKKFLIILLLPLFAKAQYTITPQTTTVTVKDEFDYIKNCLARQHGQFVAGSTICAIGLATTGTSFIIETDANAPKVIAAGGAALMFIGTIIIMDSHKWFKKASLGVSGKGNAVNVYYKF